MFFNWKNILKNSDLILKDVAYAFTYKAFVQAWIPFINFIQEFDVYMRRFICQNKRKEIDILK